MVGKGKECERVVGRGEGRRQGGADREGLGGGRRRAWWMGRGGVREWGRKGGERGGKGGEEVLEE